MADGQLCTIFVEEILGDDRGVQDVLGHCRIDYLIIILSIRAFSNPSLIRAFGKKIALNEADTTGTSPVSTGDGTLGYLNAPK